MTDPSQSVPVDPAVEGSFDVALGITGVSVSTSDERDNGDPLPTDLVERISAAVHDVLCGEGVRNATAHVVFVSGEQITTLNEEHLGGKGPTDVLSFPLDDPAEGDVFGFTPHAGDIVICPAVARDQAPEHAGTFEAEMLLLAVHAALHLLGQDHRHDAERTTMQALEATYLAPFGVSHPGDQL